MCTQKEKTMNFQVRRTKKKGPPFLVQKVAEIVRTLEKSNQTKKCLSKIYFLFSICKSEKVQSVLKTDQKADVSAHAFFSAHEAKKQQHT